MNLEQLQAMSDDQLNELSAMAILGWTKTINPDAEVTTGYINEHGQKVGYRSFDPTTDMNDAMELAEKVELFDGHYLLKRSPDMWSIASHQVDRATANTAPRCITIASILAKTKIDQ